MEKKTIVARVELLPGKEQEFLNVTEPLIPASRAEEGTISYTLYQCPASSVSFIFYEEYTNQQAIDSHVASAHFKTFAAALGGLLAKELIIESF